MKAGFCTLQRLAFFMLVGTTHCMWNPYDAYIPFVLRIGYSFGLSF